jgi:hypothetical protein
MEAGRLVSYLRKKKQNSIKGSEFGQMEKPERKKITDMDYSLI